MIMLFSSNMRTFPALLMQWCTAVVIIGATVAAATDPVPPPPTGGNITDSPPPLNCTDGSASTCGHFRNTATNQVMRCGTGTSCSKVTIRPSTVPTYFIQNFASRSLTLGYTTWKFQIPGQNLALSLYEGVLQLLPMSTGGLLGGCYGSEFGYTYCSDSGESIVNWVQRKSSLTSACDFDIRRSYLNPPVIEATQLENACGYSSVARWTWVPICCGSLPPASMP